MHKTVIAAAITAATCLPAHANEELFPRVPALETIVVVSSRTETPLRELGTSVAVMDAADIKARGFASLADVLRSMPSVDVSNSGGMGKTSSLRVRGEQGHRTLVRIDGVDVSDPTGTQSSARIQHIVSAGVARVELLRGPQGMMYGADAGGVLNITTDHVTDGKRVYLGAEGGSFDTRKVHGGLGAGNERGDFSVAASHVRTDGFNAHKSDLTGERDGADNTTVHARVGVNLSETLRLEAVARDTEADSAFDRCGWPAQDDCTGDYSQRNARLALSHKNPLGSHTLAYTRTDVEVLNLSAGDVSYDTEGDISRLELNGNTTISDTHGLIYGVEQRRDAVLAAERDQWGAYLEYQGRYADQFFLTTGVRRDDNDDFGGHTTYRISGAYIAPWVETGTLKFKTSLGTGFRAPSLYEIDYNRQQENPELGPLAPEESRGVDVGVEYFGATGFHLEAVLFDQRIEEEIYFDLVSYSGYLQGDQDSRSRGLELVASVVLTTDISINANYTFIDTEASSGAPRSRQPKHLANWGIRYEPNSRLDLSLNMRGAEGAVDTATNTDLGDYVVVDASARYRFAEVATVYLRGENLFDKDYVEVPNYNTAGAAVYAGIELTF